MKRGLSEQDTKVLNDTVQAIGRTGAKQLEIGYLEEEHPHDWWATATFQGTKVSCERQTDPVAAVLGLYAMLAAGGQCIHCGKTIALDHEWGLIDGARMREGIFETRVADQPPSDYCIREHTMEFGWARNCEGDED